MPCYEFEGLSPVVHPEAFVHDTAVLIGDVFIGQGCYVGPSASLRGDFGRLVLEKGANIQDNCVMHSFPGTEAIIEEDGHIGHGAILHGCRIGKNALIGMNAVVMDNAVIGQDSFVAAMSFVKAGFTVPPGMLALGSPARVLRTLTDKELAWKVTGTREYLDLAARSRATMRQVAPLTSPEPDRRRLPGDFRPLNLSR